MKTIDIIQHSNCVGWENPSIYNHRQPTIKVLVVDTQQIVPTTLQVDLESESDIEIVAVANNGVSALEKIEELQPDLVMIDLDLPDVNGITLIEIIKQRYPQTKTLILSNHQEQKYITRAIIAGAKGYLLKSTLGKNIIRAIRIINQGYFQLSLGY
ncbi:MAG: response regulator transcription factor [Xenococcaceae cyanobacterium MO_234.B1]|nr:response regulator transcription factor [Xenococcaceae cyanobacterium MO_234.B1]